MGKNVGHLVHVKSNVVINGKPKLPQAEAIVEGELAINYAADFETLSLKNSSGNIVTFSSDNIREKTEEAIATALNDLNERTNDISGQCQTNASAIEDDEFIISQAINDLETKKAEKTELQEEFNNLNDRINSLSTTVNTKLDQTTYNSYTSTTKSSIESMELTLVASINDIESRMAESTVIAALAEKIRELEERIKTLETT